MCHAIDLFRLKTPGDRSKWVSKLIVLKTVISMKHQLFKSKTTFAGRLENSSQDRTLCTIGYSNH